MKSIRVLITRHYDFNQTHHTEIWFRSIQSELSKHFSIILTWLIYLPEKTILDDIPNDENVEYIQDFHNAIDVIKKLKPDLIISNEYPSLIDLAFLAASKNTYPLFIKNESEAIHPNNLNQKSSTSVKITTHTPFFSSLSSLFDVPSMPQLSEKNHVTYNRIKFLFYKFNFLFSTLFFSKLKIIEKWNFLSAGIGYLFNPTFPYINPKLISDIDFCNTVSMSKLLTKNGYSHSGLFVVGEPLYDNLFKKKSQPFSTQSSKKIQVLFAPTEFNRVNTSQKTVEDAVMAITKEISQNKNQFNFFVKLHPSSHPFGYYKKHIHSIDNSVLIFQKGSIESYVERSDVLVTFSRLTSILIYPLILRKPVIICNFYNDKLPEGIEDIVFVCTDPSDLQHDILKALETNHKKYLKIDEYLETACFKTDGLASKRIVQSIISLLNKPPTN